MRRKYSIANFLFASSNATEIFSVWTTVKVTVYINDILEY